MQEENLEEEAIRHLARIEEDLEEIKNRTPNRRQSFVNGVWHGAGALIGGILGLALLGWVLSFFGVIPGVSVIAHFLQSMIDNFRHP